MKLEEFRIVHTQFGFQVQRITEWKEFVYTFSLLGIGIFGKYVDKKQYLPIDNWGNGTTFFKLKTFVLPPFKTFQSAKDYIFFKLKEHEEKLSHKDQEFYPPFE